MRKLKNTNPKRNCPYTPICGDFTLPVQVYSLKIPVSWLQEDKSHRQVSYNMSSEVSWQEGIHKRSRCEEQQTERDREPFSLLKLPKTIRWKFHLSLGPTLWLSLSTSVSPLQSEPPLSASTGSVLYSCIYDFLCNLCVSRTLMWVINQPLKRTVDRRRKRWKNRWEASAVNRASA